MSAGKRRRPQIHVNVDPDVENPPPRSIGSLIESVCRAALAEFGKGDRTEVVFLLTGSKRLRDLNRRFRNSDRATDVLSFSRGSGDAGGDVAIALDMAAATAAAAGHSFEREVAYLAVHATLHLLGFDHDAEPEYGRMRAAEEKVLAGLGLERVGPRAGGPGP